MPENLLLNLKTFIMALNVLDPEFTVVFTDRRHLSAKSKVAAALTDVHKQISSSADLTGVELRLLPPFIIDNNTPSVFPFPGFARLYCMTIVVSDANNQLVGGIDLQGFPRIGDKEPLPINKTIFYWQQSAADTKAPTQIHTLCSVIKSKAGLRQAGEIMSSLKDDSEYKAITKTLADLAKKSTGVGVALDVVTQLAGVVGKHLGKVEDKPLGTVINSFTALRGDFDQKGVIRKTFPARKVNFEMELIVRDSGQAAKAGGTRSLAKAKPGSVADTTEKVQVDLMPVV